MQTMIDHAYRRGYHLLTSCREQGSYALFVKVGQSGHYLAEDGRLLDLHKAEWQWGDSLDEAVTAAYAAAGFVMALTLESRVLLLERRVFELEKKNGKRKEQTAKGYETQRR